MNPGAHLATKPLYLKEVHELFMWLWKQRRRGSALDQEVSDQHMRLSQYNVFTSVKHM